MKLLLDTCVLSELRRPSPHHAVTALLERTADEDLFLSVVTLGELTRGIALLQEGMRKRELRDWAARLEREYGNRILPVDAAAARLWGTFTAAAARAGVTIPACDGLIAATALRHGLHVVTRNTADFRHSGALLLNPWEKG